jgi:uncharacterized protein YndB with AHSA1/START domain
VQVTGRTSASPERVWALLADPYSYAEWVAGTNAVEAADPTWPAQGTWLRHRFGPWPLQVRDATSVLACEPPRHLVLHALARPVAEVWVEIWVRPAGDGRCEVTLREDVVGGWAARLCPISEPIQRWRNRRSLRNLLALAEIPVGHLAS